jgi:hypothetical protein
MPGYPPKKIYANSYNPNRRYNAEEEGERGYGRKEDKKFETVSKLKLTEEQKAYNLQQLKKLKRKKLLTQAKKKASDKLY